MHDLQSKSGQDVFARASQHWGAGQLQEAVSLYRGLLAQDPSNFDALYLLGVVMLQGGQEAEAREWLKKAEQAAPLVTECGHAGALLQQQGRYSPLSSAVSRYQEYKKLQATDAFIISYPKCGRTWLRLLLGKFLQQQFHFAEDRRLLELNALTHTLPVPTIDISHDDYAHLKPPADVERSKARYKGKKIVFLVRDPRDTLVSFYFQYTRRGGQQLANDREFKGTISELLRHRIGGIDTLATFYNVWADQRSVPAAFMLLRYEDLHAAPAATLCKLLEFLEFPHASDKMLESVVSYCSFENMRRMEEKNLLKSNRLAAPDSNDPESFKVRREKIGGYRDYLSETDLEFLNQKIAGLDPIYDCYKK